MEDIKVNEYVKTKGGKIDKVKYNNYYMKQYIDCERGLYLRDNITKHSFNLIDLLENGDVVTFKIGSMEAIRIGIVHKFNDARSGEKVTLIDGYKLEDADIKEILTHEQFKANCYKIEQN